MRVSVNKSMVSVANVPLNGVLNRHDYAMKPKSKDINRIKNRSPSQGASHSAMSNGSSPTFYGVKRHSEDVSRE